MCWNIFYGFMMAIIILSSSFLADMSLSVWQLMPTVCIGQTVEARQFCNRPDPSIVGWWASGHVYDTFYIQLRHKSSCRTNLKYHPMLLLFRDGAGSWPVVSGSLIASCLCFWWLEHWVLMSDWRIIVDNKPFLTHLFINLKFRQVQFLFKLCRAMAVRHDSWDPVPHLTSLNNIISLLGSGSMNLFLLFLYRFCLKQL